MNYIWDIAQQMICNETEKVFPLIVINQSTGMEYILELDQDELSVIQFPQFFTKEEAKTLMILNKMIHFQDAVNCLASWKYTDIDPWYFERSFHPWLQVIEKKKLHFPYIGRMITQDGLVKCVVMERIGNKLICINLSAYSYLDIKFENIVETIPAFTKMSVNSGCVTS